MSQRRLTIKDIARELGIHHATVSRALRGDERISAATSAQVLDFAKTHGYTVNQNALNLRNKGRNEIALIVPNISHFTFSYFIGKMSDLATEQGYVVSVFQSKEQASLESEIIDILIKNRVAGVVASISKTTYGSEEYSRLVDFGIPLVFFDRVCDDLNVPKVTTDNLDAGYKGVNYLVARGHQRIAHLTGPSHINVFRDRQAGYQQALARLGLGYNREIVIEKEFELADGKKCMTDLWGDAVRPDAVLCDSFVLSAGVAAQCKHLGIAVPTQLAVLAIANDPFSALIDPPQTILEQPLDAIAQSAFDLLRKSIATKVIRSDEHCMHPIRLIERNSV